MKKGISAISGVTSPTVGEKYTYHISEWYPNTPISEREQAKVTWELFKKRSDGRFTTTHIKKKGDSSFTFGESSVGETYRLEGYLYQPEGGGLIITPKASKIPKICKVDLNYVDDSKGSVFSFTEKLRAKAHCINMFNKEVLFTLWEDDAKGSGHNTTNQLIDTKKAKVDLYGDAEVDFMLTKALMKKAMEGETDIRELEFYVTVEYYKTKKHTTSNVEVKNPSPTENKKPSQPTAIKKAKGSPAEHKPRSKKEEKGVFRSISETIDEIWDWAETQGTAQRDKPHTIEIPEGKSPAVIGKMKVEKKEKFKPVIGNGEEAVIYITSEIATEIEVDKNGDIVSYPDFGGYNGIEEHIIDNKIYCKKIKVKGKVKSAFPTYKAYIYRGNTVGEAVKKLKQDIKFNTHENAESTVLEVARHTLGNNKNYNSEGPTPPNTINKLYRLRYKIGSNKGKTSYRYRIVEDNSSNLPSIKDFKKEYQSGSMNIGTRSSISIDPWNSAGLVGCVGIRGEKGIVHPNCKNTYPNQDKENYKYIYHSINNYLEGIIPELTGVYGRRGFSTSSGTVLVKESSYKEEKKVFVLVDKLPELKLFNIEDAKTALRIIYDKYGEDIATIVEKMYRLETTHFTSGQYQHCGTGGMEVFGKSPYYGWDSTTFKNHPEHTPIGTWSAFEGKALSEKGGNKQQKDKPKTFVKLPSVLAGMEYKAEYIKRYDGNYARWYNANDVEAQEIYKEQLKGIRARIVKTFK